MSRPGASAAFRLASLSSRIRPAITIRQYSSATRLTLAYDHHAPTSGGRTANESPIIVMHGLFGSKKNNRSISKCVQSPAPLLAWPATMERIGWC